MKLTRNIPVAIYTIGSILALLSLHAQGEETAVPVQLGIAVLNAMQVQAATNEMEVALQAIVATTPVSADYAPGGGNFYSAQHLPGSAEP